MSEYDSDDSNYSPHTCTDCGMEIDSDHVGENRLPVVHAYGKAACGYATRAKELIERVRSDQRIHSESTFTLVSDRVLKAMRPSYATSPRVTVDGVLIGGYTELAKFLSVPPVTPEKKRTTTDNDAEIRAFIQLSKKPKLFIAITAARCNPCVQMKKNVQWGKSDDIGVTMYQSTHVDALCLTGDLRTPFTSKILQAANVSVEGYPTVLTYTPKTDSWATVDRSALGDHTWSPM